MAQITSVTSESLQAKIRTLLPSQQGFGEDLQASNVILPVIDLTSAAEGTSTPQYLQTALAYGSQTAFSANNSTVVLANTAGFYRIIATASSKTVAAVDATAILQMSDGLSTKNVWNFTATDNGTVNNLAVSLDITVFLRSGDSISAISNRGEMFFTGSTRQVADVNGNLVYPSGFTPQ